MSRGGRRPGAGRPKGSRDRKKAFEAVRRYCDQNCIPYPLEFLCAVMEGIDPRPKGATVDFQTSYAAAVKLLEYLHPKLKSVEVSEQSPPLQLPPVKFSKKDLEEVMRKMEREY